MDGCCLGQWASRHLSTCWKEGSEAKVRSAALMRSIWADLDRVRGGWL